MRGKNGTLGEHWPSHICERCAKTFRCKPRDRGRFCSRVCMNEWARNGGRNRHGHTSQGGPATRTYYSWKTMIQRTTNPKAHKYGNYGGRGITVCERWRKFDNFLADMGERPKDRTLDRINPDGNYEPTNCRWATAATQNRNRVDNVFLEHAGKRLCLKDWATELGLYRSTLHRRYYQGLSAEEILSPTPRVAKPDLSKRKRDAKGRLVRNQPRMEERNV